MGKHEISDGTMIFARSVDWPYDGVKFEGDRILIPCENCTETFDLKEGLKSLVPAGWEYEEAAGYVRYRCVRCRLSANPNLPEFSLEPKPYRAPFPWTINKGYEQSDPGYYIADANGAILYAEHDGPEVDVPMTKDEIEFFTRLIDISKECIYPEPKEMVDHPDHYGGADNPYEAIKVIEAHELGFNDGNAVKYVLRHKHKGKPVQDVEKACWYLDRHRANLQGIDPNDHLRSNHQKRVEKMMEGFSQTVRKSPELPSPSERLRCARLILEEAMETVEALGFFGYFVGHEGGTSQISMDTVQLEETNNENLEAIADGCADLSVVAMCALSTCGIAARPLLELVDQNNLEKIVEPREWDEFGKLKKPEGHQPPDIAGLIEFLKTGKPSG